MCGWEGCECGWEGCEGNECVGGKGMRGMSVWVGRV